MAGPNDIVEYDPQSEFPGVIGRTLDRVVAGVAGAEAGAGRHAERDRDAVGRRRASGSSPPTAGCARRRRSIGSPTAGCATRTSTPRRCARRRAASLLTGRNHHSIGLSAITETSLGYPAHHCFVGHEHGFLSEMLLEHGYNTFAVGKWHLTATHRVDHGRPVQPLAARSGLRALLRVHARLDRPVVPRPHLRQPSGQPPSTPDEGYHLNIDLADRAIQFIKDAHVHAPDKPFLLYYTPGRRALAAPGRARVDREVRGPVRRRVGRVPHRSCSNASGRSASSRSTPSCPSATPTSPAWDSLSDDARRMYARQMEVYAGFIEQTDHHLGRVIDFVDEFGELDNTIVIVMSDNGASAEGGEHGTFNEALFFNGAHETLEDNLDHFDEWGGPDTYAHYSWGWTWAGNTPFRRWKRETYRGGVTDPCIVSWPAGIAARGEVRHQYAHLIDIVPTLLDTLGIEAAGDDRRGRAVADPRHELRPHVRRRRRTERLTPPSTSRCSGAGRSTTTAGRPTARCPGRASSRRRRRAGGSGRRSPPRSWRTSTPPAGSCTASPTTRPRPATWPPTTPTSSPR